MCLPHYFILYTYILGKHFLLSVSFCYCFNDRHVCIKRHNHAWDNNNNSIKKSKVTCPSQRTQSGLDVQVFELHAVVQPKIMEKVIITFLQMYFTFWQGCWHGLIWKNGSSTLRMAGHTSRLKGVTRILQPQLDRIDMEYDEEHTEVNRQCNQYANNKDFVNLQG